MGLVQDYILLDLCLTWNRRNMREEEFKIPLCNPSDGNVLLRQSCNQNFVKHQQTPTALTCWLFPQKGSTSNWTASADLTGGAVSVGCEWISTHGIPSHRPVQKEAVDVESNYKKSYFWWPGMGILLVVIWMGVTRSEKARVAYLLD